MSVEGVKSQQQFLKDRGLFHGVVDGNWNEDSSNAMRGWAYRHESGNLDGGVFRSAPPGYTLEGDVLFPAEDDAVAEAPAAAVKTYAKTELKTHGKAPDDVLTEKRSQHRAAQPATANASQSFTVTGRDGDRPIPKQPKADAPPTKGVKVVKKIKKAKVKKSK